MQGRNCVCARTGWGVQGHDEPRSRADDSSQDVKHDARQLIDTVSQRLAPLQSAALLLPLGAQMLALLSPPSPSFLP